jgi:hypothetical protein
MSRILLAATAAALLLLGLIVPATFAADPGGSSRSVVFAVEHDAAIPAGDHVDTLIVIRANARLEGTADTVVVIDGTATIAGGATAGSLNVVNGTADLQDGATVTGNVRTFDGSVARAEGAIVRGTTGAYDANVGAFAVLLIPLLLLLFIGFGIAGVAAAVLVAAFAARQVRQAEGLISNEPGRVLVAGLAGSVLLPILALFLTATIVGAPFGLSALLVVLPALAFFGWIVAAIWVGDWIVARMRGSVEPGQPYLAAMLGVIVLAFAGLVPFVSAIATLFGYGALLLMGWRILRPPTAAPAAPAGPGWTQPAPVAG